MLRSPSRSATVRGDCPSTLKANVETRLSMLLTPYIVQLRLSVREPQVRSVELVRRADQDVGPRGCDVDWAVRPVVDGVDPRDGAGLVRELGHAGHVHERADRVRGPREGDNAGAVGQLRGEILEVERRVITDVREANDQAEVVRELQPRRDVPVVIEPRHDDLVSLAPFTGGRPGKGEVERRHVGAEDHLVRRAADEGCGRESRVGDEPLRTPARLVGAADVRVRLAQVGRDRVDYLVRNLCAARAVEEGEIALEGRKACPSGTDVERDYAHGPTLATDRIAPCVWAPSVQPFL